MVLELKTKVMSKLVSIALIIAMLCSLTGMSAVFAENTVTVSLSTAEDIVGNNFYADKMPSFIVKLSGAEGSYDVSYKATDKNNEVVWAKNDVLSIGTAGVATESVTIDEPYYGVMKLQVKLSQNGAEKGSDETYYSLSNHTDDMPHNYRSGVVSQASWYEGSEEEHVRVHIIKKMQAEKNSLNSTMTHSDIQQRMELHSSAQAMYFLQSSILF